MLYREIEPGPLLESFIQCFWMLEIDRPVASVERVVPDGRPEIVIHYRDPFERWSHQDGMWEKQTRTLFIGQARESVLLRTGLRSGIIAARFRPSGAADFLRFPMSETTNQILDLTELFGNSANELEERVYLAQSADERVNILRNFLEKRLIEKKADSMIFHIIRFVSENQGLVTLRDISNEFGVSERQIERKFRDTVGLGPKYFARIVRFQNVLRTVQENPKMNLTDLAMEYDFFDQSHFIKEFKQLSGLTPSCYFEEAHNISDYFTAQ